PWSARSPHRAKNPLGQLRIDMEAAYRASGTRTILLRAGDFLDTEPSGNWFDRIITKPLCKGRIDYPGPTNVPHAWAYLPDLARAAVALAMMRETLPTFADIPFAGYTLTGAEMAAHLGAKQGRPVRPARMAWWPLTIAAPFWPMLRGLQEMRYLWDVPHSLDDAALRAHLPGFEPTPVAHALMAAAALVDRHGPSPVGSVA
ncbi:MAG: epimerase, partial [Pseudomonadota bacterium]